MGAVALLESAFRDRNVTGPGWTALDRTECLALLATARVGRVLFTERGLPAVRPARFLLWRDAVLLQASVGGVLYAATRGGVVAFEADAFEPDLASGWWVSVVGLAAEVCRPRQVSAADLGWPGGPARDQRCLSIPADVVSGRRLAAYPPDGCERDKIGPTEGPLP